MRAFRRLTQVLFLLLFLLLIIKTQWNQGDIGGGLGLASEYEISPLVILFFNLDPLITIATFISSHSIPSRLLWSLVIIGVTLLLGRVFCGWVCPLGTLYHLFGSSRQKRKKRGFNAWHPGQKIKYYLLIGLLLSALFTLQLVGIFDPFSFLTRSFTLSIYPAFNSLLHSVFSALYFTEISFITRISEPIYSQAKRSLLTFEQPLYYQAVFLSLLFIATLILSSWRTRFWCRFICPYGALLGVLSRFAPLKLANDPKKCNGCKDCLLNCQGACSPDIPGGWRQAECVYCWNCESACPQGAISFHFPSQAKESGPRGLNLTRRHLLTTGLAAVVSVPLFRVGSDNVRTQDGRVVRRNNPQLIRPPGALPEREFLQKCIKCGECMKVCLTNVIQPTLFEAGLEGIWSPNLLFHSGYCEYNCTLCTQVCSTGAIKRLTVAEKQEWKIGLAFFDKGRCLPYALGIECRVCEEHCPTPTKAIWFTEASWTDRTGEKRMVKQPNVDPELCIGCGICVAKCVVVDQPAIYVTSIGETRSEENQLLLTVYGR